MRETTMREYYEAKKRFTQKHLAKKNSDMTVHTSDLVGYRYHKEYCFDDGAVFFEINDVVTETVKATVWVHGEEIEIEQEVKFEQVEYWSTDDAYSYIAYEKLYRQ